MKLYKYVASCKFRCDMDSFLKGEVLLKRFDAFNDPMEGFFRYAADRHQDTGINEVVGSKNKYRIACFSQDYRNFLMWAYYADGHRGVCLEYDVDQNTLPSTWNLSPVNYGPLPRFDPLKCRDGQARTFLLTKAKVWKHENEWRLLCETPSGDRVKFAAVTGVIFGINCCGVDTLARRICTNCPIVRCYQAEMTFNGRSNIRRKRLSLKL